MPAILYLSDFKTENTGILHGMPVTAEDSDAGSSK
jgi:hypothetical protein